MATITHPAAEAHLAAATHHTAAAHHHLEAAHEHNQGDPPRQRSTLKLPPRIAQRLTS